MTGLETILSQINNDARQEADELLASAKEKAGAILAFAKEEADKKTQDILKTVRKKPRIYGRGPLPPPSSHAATPCLLLSSK